VVRTGSRIAIIGAGISGLAAARALHPAYDITVLEADDRAGGHTNTVTVEDGAGVHAIDTGFMVYNDRNYPNFERMLAELGVATTPSPMSFSVSDERGEFEYNGASVNGLFATRRHLVTPTFHRMVGDLVRFNRAARELLAEQEDVSLGHWLERERFSQAFVQRLIVPQASAVWSADPAQMWSFPARFLAEFFDNHGMLSWHGRPRWRTIAGGSRRYVDALVAPWRDRLRVSAPVRAVHRYADHVTVTAAGGAPERFDAVVLAVHADQSLALLADPSPDEHEILGAFPYQPNEAVLHTDTGLLPRRRRAWASWNYHLLDEPAERATVTYHMNRLQSLRSDEQYCVTLNRTDAIDPARIVRTMHYAHPVYTRAGLAAQQRHDRISGSRRTFYCGAYWGWGFHEDGAASGLRAAHQLQGSGS
jgi:predicted NAD/FAD-binding protein